ncbi:UPF0182 family protein [Metallumcola ferriviriculae]|uniref:UPF0182 protein MFMK1_002252 n=1 Tax=Metallumcola ferriviriculae TaxID=3039180 RepID=A0AAU0UT30_9FIRM|nr:UPF0182 family protein [Desulfitibacteraceae bacterium MK1]
MRFRRYLLGTVILAVMALVFFSKLGLNLYVDWLWFNSVDYSQIFLKTVYYDWLVRLVVLLSLFILLLVNLLLTRKHVLQRISLPETENVIPLKNYYLSDFLTGKRLVAIYTVVSILLAALLSVVASGQWLTVLKFLHRQPFNITEPLFNLDAGFYVFQLPFFNLIYTILMTGLVVSTLLVAAVHFLTDPSQFSLNKAFTRGKIHLSVLVSLILMLKAVGYRLAMYDLLLSPRGVAFGASYTDVHAQLPALKIMFVLALVAAAAVLVNVFLKKFRWVLTSIILLVISSVVLGSVFPGLMQKFIVEPDEFRKEEPYLEHNIDFTRQAFDLDGIDNQFFSVTNQFAGEDIKANQGTLDNVRIWDWRPLIQTYSQLQEIQLYYNFGSVDVDRYQIDGQLRQVMLSARELNQGQLPEQAKTWINQKLRYTHGYGLVMSPASAVTEEGLPAFYLKDIPSKASVSDVNVKKPQIYYGEQTDSYVFVKTGTTEFDYPAASGENHDTVYQADNGIKLGSIFKRLALAAYLQDIKILLAGDLNADSRLLLNRTIGQRMRKIAPFLEYDRDPYLVLADGELFWMQDAYTTTNKFPYSETMGGVNYIRNSVKIVVNAYDGSVRFYLAEPNDPIIRSYAAIFPGTFLPLEKMPSALRSHVRYPVDLFMLQAQQYSTYHMTDPRDFYNKEGQWNLPMEIVGDKKVPMEPYYTVMRLPDEEKNEYLLMLPFTPAKKLNMTSWLAVRNSPKEYGGMIDFRFPRDSLVFGPMQIEARIDQDSEISSQLTLWNQRGSEIIRGNLLVIPIKDSILYVEPLFLQGEQSRLPELRRVIVAYKDNIVMAKTFEQALETLFKDEVPVPAPQPEPNPQPELPTGNNQNVDELIKSANQLFNLAQEKLRQGDWNGYGDAINELDTILNQLEQISNNPAQGN